MCLLVHVPIIFKVHISSQTSSIERQIIEVHFVKLSCTGGKQILKDAGKQTEIQSVQ